ncbi:MAG: DNA polymerase III subunit delta [Armatimonadota bacterium]|nr:DNA polymerase III subunit delta [Armatimonadota bacterium]
MASHRSEAAPRAYLLTGSDEFQKRRALEELLQLLVDPDLRDFDLEELDGETATSDRIISGLSTPPLGNRRRVVLVRFANKMNPDEQRKLARLLESVPPSGCLIMVNPAVEKSDGRPKKGAEVLGDLSKAVRKIGEVREFGTGSSREKADRAREFAKSLIVAAGKQISGDVLAFLVQRVGDDFAIIASEVQKLLDWVADRSRITREDVEAVTVETPEEKIFRFLDAIASRNTAAAMQLLDDMLESSDDIQADASRTLAMIARQFRLIWQARMLAEAGVKRLERVAVPEKLKAALPSDPNLLDIVERQPWQAGKLSAQAKSFSLAKLCKCFEAIARADAALKGVEGNIDDPRTVMHLLVVELATGS